MTEESSHAASGGLVNWIDSRLPVFSYFNKEYGQYPTPRNFNYWWNFGALAMFMLVVMILTGLMLAMQFTANVDVAFDSVQRIVRDVNYGWLLRSLHANGGSFFFLIVYIHLFRGMYYGSFKGPRELLWMLGVLILLLMMATAFMGYVLPWGQLSFWAATVITNLFTAIPLVGEAITTWLWGGFAVDNPTLNRFYALHFFLPFVIVGVVILHVIALHVVGSNNPLGIEPKGPQDTIPFHPYYTVKDSFGLSVFVLIYAAVVFFAPDFFQEPENNIPANPLVTPAEIVPEWYFLPFFAILRSVPDIWFIEAKLAGRDCAVRLDLPAFRAAVARHLEGAQRQVPADLQAVLLAVGGRLGRARLGRQPASRRHGLAHRAPRDALLLRAFPRGHTLDRQVRAAAAAAG